MAPSLLPLLDAPLPGEPSTWARLQVFPWVQALHGCPQDPVHHAEGDVGIHTAMVLEALVRLPAWQALPASERQATWLACLLHDVAKPATTRTEDDGRITARGHSRRGELMARRILYELGVPFAQRELVCTLIRYHQIPFYLIERPDAARLAAEISVVSRCDLLALVAEADMRGRRCADQARILDQIALFVEFCRDESCLATPRPFADAHTRQVFFRDPSRPPEVPVHDDTRSEVVVLAGLPGSGKDTLARQRFGSLPVVSLDDLRLEMDIPHGDNQGPVVQAARERARTHLRRGEPFVWNATNLQHTFRRTLLTMLTDYAARVRLVYVEVPLATLLTQNRNRAAVVPERALLRLLDRWEIPDATEVHTLEHAVR